MNMNMEIFLLYLFIIIGIILGQVINVVNKYLNGDTKSLNIFGKSSIKEFIASSFIIITSSIPLIKFDVLELEKINDIGTIPLLVLALLFGLGGAVMQENALRLILIYKSGGISALSKIVADKLNAEDIVEKAKDIVEDVVEEQIEESL